MFKQKLRLILGIWKIPSIFQRQTDKILVKCKLVQVLSFQMILSVLYNIITITMIMIIIIITIINLPTTYSPTNAAKFVFIILMCSN